MHAGVPIINSQAISKADNKQGKPDISQTVYCGWVAAQRKLSPQAAGCCGDRFFLVRSGLAGTSLHDRQ